MPDGRGSLFDVLDRAAARGVDVRALFWRANDEAGFPSHELFSGSAEHHAMLAARGARFHARWDRAAKIYCQHQKSWLIDAGEPGEVAFVGGINLHIGSVVAPGHAGAPHDQAHDVYAELLGPAATDVHHNFVQRWNEASERGLAGGAWPHAGTSDLAFPAKLSPEAGDAVVQIQRTVRAGHYTNGAATPGGSVFAIAEGETSIFEQYQRAIAAARSSIYLENQALGCPRTLEALHEALHRGVAVVVLTPANASPFMTAARKDPRSQAFFARFDALAEHEHFALVGLASRGEGGLRRNVYVHAKAAVIDDAWATIGSCNIGVRSFFGDTELNASFWEPATARSLRVELLREHLGVDTAALGDREALALYRERAHENARALASGADGDGIAFALDPREYARA
jgi:phosphatidylserine/phosphatidylglycerophosphate/cardiolipin synthase-like enzyme